MIPEDAAHFVAAYETALDDARTSLDLAGVHEVVERWRGTAILQTDPAADRRTMRRAAALATGEPSPDDEPLEVTTSKTGLHRVPVVETLGDGTTSPSPGAPFQGAGGLEQGRTPARTVPESRRPAYRNATDPDPCGLAPFGRSSLPAIAGTRVACLHHQARDTHRPRPVERRHRGEPT